MYLAWISFPSWGNKNIYLKNKKKQNPKSAIQLWSDVTYGTFRMQILLVWKSKYNPIKRDIVHQSKCNGGLGLMNVLYKAQSILISTFLKQFLNSQENHSFLKYYCSLRLNPLFNIRELPRNVSYVCPKYLDNLVHLTRKLIHIPKFPNVNSRDIYFKLYKLYKLYSRLYIIIIHNCFTSKCIMFQSNMLYGTK